MPYFLSEEGASVGEDEETPVTEEYRQCHNRFTGRINHVTVDAPRPQAPTP